MSLSGCAVRQQAADLSAAADPMRGERDAGSAQLVPPATTDEHRVEFEGWVNPSRVPAVWLDSGEGARVVRAIRMRFPNDDASSADAGHERTLSRLSLIVECDGERVMDLPLGELVPGAGRDIGRWPVSWEADGSTLVVSLPLACSSEVRVGLRASPGRPILASVLVELLPAVGADSERASVRVVRARVPAGSGGASLTADGERVGAIRVMGGSAAEDLHWSIAGRTEVGLAGIRAMVAGGRHGPGRAGGGAVAVISPRRPTTVLAIVLRGRESTGGVQESAAVSGSPR